LRQAGRLQPGFSGLNPKQQARGFAQGKRPVMDINGLDFVLAGLGLVIGFVATCPLELRHRRLLYMTLIPLLLIGMRQLIPEGHDVAVNLAGFTGFLVPSLLLALVLAPSLAWALSGVLMAVFDNPDNRPVQGLDLHQVRRRSAAGLHGEAYRLLTRNLRKNKPTYEALYLKAALEQEMGMPARARRTVRRLGRYACHDAQRQFVTQLLQTLSDGRKN